jgi:putative peptide zinc metalloprotease protein
MTSVMEDDVATRPTGGAHRVHRLAPGTELLGEYRDSAYEEPKFLVQRSDGQAMQLPRLLYRVACSLDGRRDDEIAADLSTELGAELTGDEVAFLVEERLRPVGLVAPDRAAADEPADPAPDIPMPVRSDLLLALRYRAGVIPAHIVWRIAGLFQPLFRRPVWPLVLGAFALVDAWILLQGDLLDRVVAGVGEMGRRPGLLLVVLGLTVLSGVLHEFGHVGACRYGGARPGDIGVGLYLVWPAFYSTVTDSYRLDRVGRLRTDLGGLYIDAAFMAGLGMLYLHTGEPWLLLALLGMHVEAAWQLLPNLRLDGYYILADLVGVPDLFSYVKPALLSVLPGRPTHPAVRELKPRARRIIVLWVAAVVPTLLFWLAFFVVALPRLLPAAWQALLEHLQVVDRAARDGEIVTTTLGVTELLFLLLPWAGGVMALWMLVDVVAGRVAARSGLARLRPATKAAARRLATLVALSGLGALVLVRVVHVALSHPPTPDETSVADSALAGMRGDAGTFDAGAGNWLLREQLVVFARATGAFDRHATVVAGARELAVLACAVLVFCLIGLVGMRRLPPLAAGLPLAAVLALGPAVTTLATVGSGLVGVAWAAAGVLLVACARRRGAAAAGIVMVALGVATEILVAVPLAAAVAVLALAGSGRTAGPRQPPGHAAAPSRGPRDLRRAVPALSLPVRNRHARHARPDSGPGNPRRWLAVALVLPLAAGAAALGEAADGGPLQGPERTVLLLIAAVVVMGGLLIPALRPLRPFVAAAWSATALSALPWWASGDVLALGLVTAGLLAVFMTAAFVRRPAAHRPHPLHRAAVAVPTLLLVVVGALFLPATASVPPHAALASWITAPDGPTGTVLVPAGLWGDLLRDGVPPSRLVRAGSGTDADWTVVVGAPLPGAEAAATFARDGTALSVVMSERARSEADARARADQRVQDAAREQEAAREQLALVQAEQQVARGSFGSLLAQRPGFGAPPDVEELLRNGGVDMRVLVILSSLTQDYAVTVAAVPVTAGDDPGLPRRQVLITALGYVPAVRPDVTAELSQRLTAWPPGIAPVEVTPGPEGVLVAWAPSSPGP